MDIGARSIIMRQSYVEDLKDFLSQQTTKNTVLERDLHLIFSLLSYTKYHGKRDAPKRRHEKK